MNRLARACFACAVREFGCVWVTTLLTGHLVGEQAKNGFKHFNFFFFLSRGAGTGWGVRTIRVRRLRRNSVSFRSLFDKGRVF